MDGDGKKPRGGPKAAGPAPATNATQRQPPALAALETPALCDDDATAAQQVDADQTDVASVDESGSGGGTEQEEEGNHDDDDEEQVERFYALLANIRAMRGLPLHKHNVVASSSFCTALGGDTDTAVDSTRTKRLRRSAEPPWRPVFRMEDFEEPPPPAASTSCKIRKRTTRGEVHDDTTTSTARAADQRVRQSPSSTMPHAAVRFQQSDSTS